MHSIAVVLLLGYTIASPATNCIRPCTRQLSPMCGSDHKTYSNLCILRSVACLQKGAITKLYDGKCRAGNPCAFICGRIYKPVCGSDGKVYANQCLLRAKACQQKTAIMVVSNSTAVTAERCDKCEILCIRDSGPVCGSDGRTHVNECAMRITACKERRAIIAVHSGNCKNHP